jgi:hypothetical protein
MGEQCGSPKTKVNVDVDVDVDGRWGLSKTKWDP